MTEACSSLPKVSIDFPVHNGGQYLEASADAVFLIKEHFDLNYVAIRGADFSPGTL